MDEKSLWFGYGLGMITSGLVFVANIIYNEYVYAIPQTEWFKRTLETPVAISVTAAAIMILLIGTAISLIFLLSKQQTKENECDDEQN